MHGGFGSRVGEHPRYGHIACHGAHIDDGAGFVSLEEVVTEDLAGAEYRLEINIDQVGQFLFRDFQERGR